MTNKLPHNCGSARDMLFPHR